ncbi:unnamed protein product [Effrenium voratum]|uniref:Uncharacterized protein n=1 Tax=Effrenium voratum TaxID=2562239 RepID=A0AA36JQV0_9DINO|nr:unnamed protein product [Effrenium voratum]
MTADRELWIAIAEEHLPSLRPQADGKWPLDKAIQDLRYNPRVTMHLLPLPSAVAKVATAPPPKEASGGKVATRPRCPELLIGCELKTKDGKPVCYGFNLESGWEEADLSAQWDHGLIWRRMQEAKVPTVKTAPDRRGCQRQRTKPDFRQSQWTIRSNELKDRPDGLDGLRGADKKKTELANQLYDAVFEIARALDPKDMLSQLQAHEQNSSNRILLGGMPRGRKLRPFVSEFGQYLTVLGPVQDVDSLKHFLQLKPKGSKITRRQICTWGEARVCAQQFQWAILPPMPTAEAGLVEKAVVGIPRSPEEFVKAAVAAGHPRDIAVFLQKETKAAVIANRDLTAVDIIRRRIEFIKHWLGRRSALEEEEKKLHAAMPEYVRVVLKGKNILLMGEMLRDLGYPDVMLQQHVAEGFKLTGWLPETGYFQKRVRRPELRVEQALQMAKGVNHGILKQMRAEELTDLDRATWEETCKEVEKGWIFEDVAPNLHGVLLAKRFGLQQKEKVRVIDDYTVGGLNKTCGLKEKLRVQAVDEMAAMIAYSLDTCEASAHPRVLGRTYDLEAAYKQYAVHPADRAISSKKCVDFADTFKTLGLEELADEIEDILQKGQLTAKEARAKRKNKTFVQRAGMKRVAAILTEANTWSAFRTLCTDLSIAVSTASSSAARAVDHLQVNDPRAKGATSNKPTKKKERRKQRTGHLLNGSKIDLSFFAEEGCPSPPAVSLAALLHGEEGISCISPDEWTKHCDAVLGGTLTVGAHPLTSGTVVRMLDLILSDSRLPKSSKLALHSSRLDAIEKQLVAMSGAHDELVEKVEAVPALIASQLEDSWRSHCERLCSVEAKVDSGFLELKELFLTSQAKVRKVSEGP